MLKLMKSDDFEEVETRSLLKMLNPKFRIDKEGNLYFNIPWKARETLEQKVDKMLAEKQKEQKKLEYSRMDRAKKMRADYILTVEINILKKLKEEK